MPGINQLVKIKGLFRLKDYNSLMVGSTAVETMASSTSWRGPCGGIKLLTSWMDQEVRKRGEEREPESHNPLQGHASKDQNFPVRPSLRFRIPGSVTRKAREERGNRGKGKLYCVDKVGLGTTPQPQGRHQRSRGMR